MCNLWNARTLRMNYKKNADNFEQFWLDATYQTRFNRAKEKKTWKVFVTHEI